MDVIAVVIAGLSLVLSGFALYRHWLANRQAAIEVRFETATGSFKRIVLYNHGPHEAHQVDFTLLDKDGQPVGRIIDDHVLPVPDLYAKQDYHVRVSQAMGSWIMAAEVTWSDGRPGRHTKRVWLTPRQVS